MTRDPLNPAGSDVVRIHLERGSEVMEWARRFGVTEVAIRRAVERVGNNAEAVRRELGGQRRASPSAAGLALGDQGGPQDQLLEDGQEEVFAREELLRGEIEHHIGEEGAKGVAPRIPASE